MKIGDVCIFKTNFPDADFWLQRKGSEQSVGKPSKEFYEENIGVKIKDEYNDMIDKNYLFYYFQFLFMQGVFAPISHGTLSLKNISISDIKSIPIQFKLSESIDSIDIKWDGETDTSRVKDNSEYDAVLIGGLDYRPGDYKIDAQVGLFKSGFGEDKNVKGFPYNTDISIIKDFISQNPNIPVFMFSAGASKSASISKDPNVDVKNIYIIEPYGASQKTTMIVNNAVSNGVPAENVFVGNTSGRGQGIVQGASSSNSSSHWGSLKNVGQIVSSLSE